MAPIKKTLSPLFLVILLVILSVLAMMFYAGTETFQKRFLSDIEEEQTENTPDEQDNPSWHTYRSEEFGFEMQYPEGWEVLDFPDDKLFPRINIVRKGAQFVSPITHHSDVTNVSVFPHGIPTEGLFSLHRPSDFQFSEKTKNEIDFYLKNGDTFATFAGFSDYPPSWMGSGFIWSYVRIDNLKNTCLQGDIEIPFNRCDPIFGDSIVYEGNIDPDIRDIQEKMLKSFHFVSS